jgi:hypothetical protein
MEGTSYDLIINKNERADEQCSYMSTLTQEAFDDLMPDLETLSMFELEAERMRLASNFDRLIEVTKKIAHKHRLAVNAVISMFIVLVSLLSIIPSALTLKWYPDCNAIACEDWIIPHTFIVPALVALTLGSGVMLIYLARLIMIIYASRYCLGGAYYEDVYWYERYEKRITRHEALMEAHDRHCPTCSQNDSKTSCAD